MAGRATVAAVVVTCAHAALAVKVLPLLDRTLEEVSAPETPPPGGPPVFSLLAVAGPLSPPTADDLAMPGPELEPTPEPVRPDPFAEASAAADRAVRAVLIGGEIERQMSEVELERLRAEEAELLRRLAPRPPEAPPRSGSPPAPAAAPDDDPPVRRAVPLPEDGD